MKGMRIIIFALCFVFVLSVASAFAENNGIETLLFRDIPWYTTEPEVLKAMKQLYTGTRKADISTNVKLNSMELDTIDFDTRVKTGGDLVIYWDYSVAGYKAFAALQFMYPIHDGQIDRKSDLAEFYMAQYRISFSDYNNMREVYDDLVAKLTNLYGEKFATTQNTVLWKALDGSMVGIEYSQFEIRLTYLAPEADNRLIALREIYDKEVADAEAAERESISNNYDGL